MATPGSARHLIAGMGNKCHPEATALIFPTRHPRRHLPAGDEGCISRVSSLRLDENVIPK